MFDIASGLLEHNCLHNKGCRFLPSVYFPFSTQAFCGDCSSKYTPITWHFNDKYRRRYNDLTDRFRAEEEKLKRLTAERKKRDTESVAIGGMLFELTELEAPPIEFDEKLWHAVVDHVTIYHDDRLVFSLKDGTEITVEL